MEQQVTVMQWYVVTGTAGATVSTPEGVTLCTIPDGGQGSFFAITPIVVTSDDSVSVVNATFKYAPAKLKALGLIGGGANTLPSGYLAAEFAHRTAHQILWTGVIANSETAIEIDCSTPIFDGSTWLFSNADIDKTETNKKFMLGRHSGGKASWYEFGRSSGTTSFAVPNNGREIVKMRKGFLQIGSQSQTISAAAFVGTTDLAIFGNVRDTAVREMTVYGCKIHQDGELVRDFLPCLDSAGRAGMYDKVSKKMYHSANGEFAIGMTLSQARKLGKLPAGGGTLTVSLPSNWQEDEGVLNARAEAEANGWQITVRTYDATAGAAATFGMRRIWVRKAQDEGGGYVAADGSRWRVDWCVDIWGADPQELGYEPYRSVDAAVAYWELVPYVVPEEEFLTEPTTNEYE